MLTLLIVLTQIFLVATNDDVIRVGKVSYQYYNETVSWGSAKNICEDEGGMLATPRNLEEYMAIVNMQKNRNNADVWVGFHNLFNYLEFLSVTGVGLHHYYEFWKKSPIISKFNWCVASTVEGYVQKACSNSMSFICEKGGDQVLTPSDIFCYKKIGGYKREASLNKCYKYHQNPKTWGQAKAICEAEGAQLVVIRSKEEEDFLQTFVAQAALKTYNDTYVFVGMHDLFEKDNYVSVKNEPENTLPYMRWDLDQPSEGDHRCVALKRRDAQRTGALHNVFCGNLLSYVCSS